MNYLRVIEGYDISSTQIGNFFVLKEKNAVFDLILIASDMH